VQKELKRKHVGLNRHAQTTTNVGDGDIENYKKYAPRRFHIESGFLVLQSFSRMTAVFSGAHATSHNPDSVGVPMVQSVFSFTNPDSVAAQRGTPARLFPTGPGRRSWWMNFPRKWNI
jgi:hypothetical protein